MLGKPWVITYLKINKNLEEKKIKKKKKANCRANTPGQI